jgi:hypothetical protein
MKTPPGMSKEVTHRLIIVDRSRGGMQIADEMSKLARPRAHGCVYRTYFLSGRGIAASSPPCTEG